MNTLRRSIHIIGGEVRRVLADQLAHPGDSISWLIYTVLLFVSVLVILRGVTGEDLSGEAQLQVLVGWLSFQVAATCMANLPDDIEDEAETGTLEQLAISPVPLGGIFLARSIAYFLSTGALGLAAGAGLLIFITRSLPQGAGFAFALVFLISLVGAYGLGFALAGLTMVVKRISAVTGVILSLMIFLTGSLVGLEKINWLFEITRFLFPLTWGISIVRDILTGVMLKDLIANRELIGLVVHSVLYLLIGLGLFTWGTNTSRRSGSLGHY